MKQLEDKKHDLMTYQGSLVDAPYCYSPLPANTPGKLNGKSQFDRLTMKHTSENKLFIKISDNSNGK